MLTDEEGWEEIEKSELEIVFGRARDFVEFAEKERRFSTVGNDFIMQLYGLMKVAMEGPCYEPQPMALNLSARAKWNAWQRLGNMSPRKLWRNTYPFFLIYFLNGCTTILLLKLKDRPRKKKKKRHAVCKMLILNAMGTNVTSATVWKLNCGCLQGFDVHFIDMNRTCKVTKGGQVIKYSAILACGNYNGVIGFAKAKGPAVPLALQKGRILERAFRDLNMWLLARGTSSKKG